MARAATCYDAPPILEPTREMVEAVRAYYSARLAADDAYRAYLKSQTREAFRTSRETGLKQTAANAHLEDVFPIRTAWYPIDGEVWGWAKTSKRGLELVQRRDRCYLNH